MKSKIVPAAFFSLILLYTIPFSFGAGDKQSAAMPSKGPSVFFPTVKYEFAPVAEGIIVRHNFIIKNRGDETLMINKVRTG